MTTLHDNSLSMSAIAEDGAADYYDWLAEQEATIRHKNGFRVVTDGASFYVLADGDPDPLFDGTKYEALTIYRKLSGKS